MKWKLAKLINHWVRVCTHVYEHLKGSNVNIPFKVFLLQLTPIFCLPGEACAHDVWQEEVRLR